MMLYQSVLKRKNSLQESEVDTSPIKCSEDQLDTNGSIIEKIQSSLLKKKLSPTPSIQRLFSSQNLSQHSKSQTEGNKSTIKCFKGPSRTNDSIIKIIQSPSLQKKLPTISSMKRKFSLKNSSQHSKSEFSFNKNIKDYNSDDDFASFKKSKPKRKKNYQKFLGPDVSVSTSSLGVACDISATDSDNNCDSVIQHLKEIKIVPISFLTGDTGCENESKNNFPTTDSTAINNGRDDNNLRKISRKRKKSFPKFYDSDFDASNCSSVSAYGLEISDSYNDDDYSPSTDAKRKRSKTKTSPKKRKTVSNSEKTVSKKVDHINRYQEMHDYSNEPSGLETSDYNYDNMDDDYSPSTDPGRRQSKTKISVKKCKTDGNDSEKFPVSEIMDFNEKYREMRDRNNEASRRSRLNRKLFEIELQQNKIYLESENIRLLSEVSGLESRIEKLSAILMKMSKNPNSVKVSSDKINNSNLPRSGTIRVINQANKSDENSLPSELNVDNPLKNFQKFQSVPIPVTKIQSKDISEIDTSSNCNGILKVKPVKLVESADESHKKKDEEINNNGSQENQIVCDIKIEKVDDEFVESEEADRELHGNTINNVDENYWAAADVKSEINDTINGEMDNEFRYESDNVTSRVEGSSSCNNFAEESNKTRKESSVAEFCVKKSKKPDDDSVNKGNKCTSSNTCDEFDHKTDINSYKFFDKINDVTHEGSCDEVLKTVNRKESGDNKSGNSDESRNSLSMKKFYFGFDGYKKKNNSNFIKLNVNLNKDLVENDQTSFRSDNSLYSVLKINQSISNDETSLSSDNESSLFIATDEDDEEFSEASNSNNDSKLPLSLEELDIKEERIRLEKENILLKAKVNHIERAIKDFSRTLIQSDRLRNDIGNDSCKSVSIKSFSDRLSEIRKRNNIASRKSRLKRKLSNLSVQQEFVLLEKENKLLRKKVDELETYIKKINLVLINVAKIKK